MPQAAPLKSAPSANRSVRFLAAALTAAGLTGHLVAAHAIGGSALAYQHHVMGFALILLVSVALVGGLGRVLWRGQPAATWLAVGLIQLAFGAWMALDPRAAVGG
jgi:hypothetical protein